MAFLSGLFGNKKKKEEEEHTAREEARREEERQLRRAQEKAARRAQEEAARRAPLEDAPQKPELSDAIQAERSEGTAARKGQRAFEPRNNHFQNGPIGGNLSMQSIHKLRTKMIVDRSAIMSAGFEAFVKAFCEAGRSANHFLFIPGFAMKELNDRAAMIETLVHDRICIRWDGSDDYASLLEKRATLAPFLMIVNDDKVADELRQVAARVKIQIRLVQLTDDGQLRGIFTPSRRPQIVEPAADGFAIATAFAQFAYAKLPHARLGIGSRITTSSGKQIRLGREIAHNENSITYQVEGERFFAKVFAENMLTTLERNKVDRMLSKPIERSGLCWPLETISDEKGTFVGYTLAAFDGVPLSQCIFQPEEMARQFPSWGRAELSRLVETIMSMVQYMHSHGILFGSIEPASIWVKNEREVYFLDTDRYQIEGFPCMKYSYAYCAPESVDKAGKIRLVTMAEERFAIAELAFTTIMIGKNAYPTENGSEALQNIREMRFGFSWNGNKGAADERRKVGRWRFVWSHLSPPLKECFYKTFMGSNLQFKPEARRSAEHWTRLFGNYAKELDSSDLFDKDSRKLFPPSYKRSPQDRFIRCACCGVEHPDWYFRKDFLDAGYAYCRSCLRRPSNDGFTCKYCGKSFIYTYESSIFHKIKRETDGWKLAKWCKYCKNKKVPCVRCGNEFSVIKLRDNGMCVDCHEAWLNETCETRVCKNRYCGRTFVITNGEAEYFRKKGLSLPMKCKSCRGR